MIANVQVKNFRQCQIEIFLKITFLFKVRRLFQKEAKEMWRANSSSLIKCRIVLLIVEKKKNNIGLQIIEKFSSLSPFLSVYSSIGN